MPTSAVRVCEETIEALETEESRDPFSPPKPSATERSLTSHRPAARKAVHDCTVQPVSLPAQENIHSRTSARESLTQA